MCQAYNFEHKTRFMVLIPSNAYGINDRFDEHGHVVSSLIHRIYEAKINKQPRVTLWGSGKPIRDFLFSEDVADACIFLMNHDHYHEVLNVGSGKSISIFELAQLVRDVVRYEGEIVVDKSKPDGNLNRLLDSQRINDLGFSPKMPLKEGLKITFEWYKEKRGH